MQRKNIQALKEMTLRAFANSEKKHLIITGSVNMGKSSLINEILKDLDREDYSLIRTYLLDNGDVELEDYISGQKFLAVKRKAGKMEELDDFFNNKGAEILASHLKADQEIFVMDEIGKFEMGKEKFSQALAYLLDSKRAILAVRRNANLIYTMPRVMEDSLIVDLDLLNAL